MPHALDFKANYVKLVESIGPQCLQRNGPIPPIYLVFNNI